jgi:hypothetical protein
MSGQNLSLDVAVIEADELRDLDRLRALLHEERAALLAAACRAAAAL